MIFKGSSDESGCPLVKSIELGETCISLTDDSPPSETLE